MQKLVNILIAVVVGFIIVKSCQRKMEIDSWASTTGQISSYEVEQYDESKRTKTKDGRTKTKWEEEYRVNFSYTFSVGGVGYNGRFSVDDLDNQREINQVLRQNPNGKQIQIKYDPNNPRDNVKRS